MIAHGPIGDFYRKPPKDDESSYPVDFCRWLQSNEFFERRREILEDCGARWLTC